MNSEITISKGTMLTSSSASESALIRAALTFELPVPFKAVLAFTNDDQLLLVGNDKERRRIKFVDPADCSVAFATSAQDSGWISNSTIRHGRTVQNSWIVQFYPPARYRIAVAIDSLFQPDGIEQDVVELQVPMPGFIFVGVGRNAYLWACTRKTFSPQMPLYQAPLPNVSNEGSLCFGTNTHPDASLETIDEIWQIWWDGIFNAHSVSGKSKRYRDVRHALWEARTKKAYPSRDLVKIDKFTAAQAVEKVTKER